jgi:4-amino-4-deoxy-L-arabinose transferase-like glycosyltransferase
MLQEWIHKLEEGGGLRPMKYVLAALVLVLLVAGYNWRGFRNFSTQEAMDTAQLARNLAEGRGYTTLFVRPFSMHLVKKRNEEKHGIPEAGRLVDYSMIREAHPDIANPPVYPVMLAGLMKVLPFRFDVDLSSPFWSEPAPRPTPQSPRVFVRHQPDFLISLFNQALFFGVVVLTFFWARRMFDAPVAWLSAVLLLLTEIMWRFSVSGLSTMLVLLIFVGLVWCLTLLENEAREPKWGAKGVMIFAASAGVLLGVGALTRYSFAWLVLPAVLFVILFAGQRRAALALLVVAAFMVVLMPWVIRNYSISGMPFGTATYAPLESTFLFPDYRLQRSLEPDFTRVHLTAFWHKLFTNTRAILQGDLLKLGGNWIGALFLAGLLLGFRNPALRRIRYFLVGSIGLLVVVQALGRTHLSEDSPEINTENLLVLLTPFVMVYGVSFFYALLDQIELPLPQLRYAVIGIFGVLISLPMLFFFLPPKTNPVAYPPYYPPLIQQSAYWMNENELMMSDIPWGVGWYGNRQCVWLTLNAQSEFFAINDFQKPVAGLYLTPQTMDARFVSEWIRAGEHSWGSFILESIVKREVPPTFPLREAPAGYLPEQLFLTDRKRWRMPE